MNKKVGFLGLTAFLAITLLITTVKAEAFSDVYQQHTNYDAIEFVKSQGIVQGYADGSYKPNTKINRAEFLKIILEATAEDSAISGCNQASYSFSDTATGQWFSPYVCLGKKSGIVGGYSDESYKPANNINFVEAAKIMNIAYGEDESTSSVWYQDYVEFLENEFAIPVSISSLDKEITRGEMAEMIYRIDAGVTNKPSLSYVSLTGTTAATSCIDEGCNEVAITTDGSYRYIMANGIPNHETGSFPNSGNPNTISEQDYDYRITLNPAYKSSATAVQVPGVSLNGVFFEPGTAERNGAWSYEGLQDELNLGLDMNNAHVQPTGAYHYHGIPEGLVDILSSGVDLIQVGWAGDGFPMYVSMTGAYKSSYQLKSGTRSTSPYGNYNGTYTEDWEYNKDLGDLDDCNGISVDGNYIYLLTEDFPYISRCLHGTPDESFNKGGGGAGPTGGPTSGTSGPPQAALDVCNGKSSGSSCNFTDGNGSHNGTCDNTPDGMACKP